MFQFILQLWGVNARAWLNRSCEGVVDFARQLNFELDGDAIHELLSSHKQ